MYQPFLPSLHSNLPPLTPNRDAEHYSTRNGLSRAANAKAPFPENRCSQLEPGTALQDYDVLADDELKALMKQRGVELRGRYRRRHRIRDLKEGDHDDAYKYREWKLTTLFDFHLREKHYLELEEYFCHESTLADDLCGNMGHVSSLQNRRERIKAVLNWRQPLMFGSTFKEDPNQKPFIELPGELRNMIYQFTLFDGEQSPRWSIYIDGLDDQFSPHDMHTGCYTMPFTISILKVLGTLSKEIRTEVRSLFWAAVQVERIHVEVPRSKALPQFIKYISPGAATVSRNLKMLDLEFAASNLFHEDLNELRAHFVRGAQFLSPSLDHFANSIAAMPSLTRLNMFIHGASWEGTTPPEDELIMFRHFIFSGGREKMLWMKIKERLQANDGPAAGSTVVRYGKTIVHINYDSDKAQWPGSDKMIYRKWHGLY